MYDLIHADVLRWAREYRGPKFHACLCDAPYHLTEIVKRFGKEGSAPARQGAYARVSRGFMGAQWDGGDEIAFQPETWRAIGQHLHGGAFLMVFAGTRGYHRMATAIEEAGFIIHPAIGWSFGSGMPKATRVDDQIDSAAGQVQRAVGKHPNPGSTLPRLAMNDGWQALPDITAPTSDLAQSWQGHRYGLQALKPAFEFICVAQKPYERVTCAEIHAATGWDAWSVTTSLDTAPATRLRILKKWGIRLPSGHVPGHAVQIVRKALHSSVTNCVELWWHHEHGAPELLATVARRPFRAWATDNSVACMLVTQGAGALNIDAGRVGTDTVGWAGAPASGAVFNSATSGLGKVGAARPVVGRWPANLLLSHNADCALVGSRRVRSGHGDADYTKTGVQGPTSIATNVKTGRHYGDPDGMETIPAWRCTPGCAVARLGAQSGETGNGYRKNPSKPDVSDSVTYGFSGLRGARGHDDTGTAARFFHCGDWMYERLEDADPLLYVAKASTAERDAGLDSLPTITVSDGRAKSIDNGFQRGETGRKNPHPTVKPVALIKQLAALLLPPDCYAPERRLLIPFAGVASEMLGALLAGWDQVVGVELEAKHCHVGRLRLDQWMTIAAKLRTTDEQRIVQTLARRAPVAAAEQLELML